jgi:hypothetical protein
MLLAGCVLHLAPVSSCLTESCPSVSKGKTSSNGRLAVFEEHGDCALLASREDLKGEKTCIGSKGLLNISPNPNLVSAALSTVEVVAIESIADGMEEGTEQGVKEEESK